MKQFQNQTFRMVTFVLTIVSIAACYWQCVMVPQQDAANKRGQHPAVDFRRKKPYTDSNDC